MSGRVHTARKYPVGGLTGQENGPTTLPVHPVSPCGIGIQHMCRIQIMMRAGKMYAVPVLNTVTFWDCPPSGACSSRCEPTLCPSQDGWFAVGLNPYGLKLGRNYAEVSYLDIA